MRYGSRNALWVIGLIIKNVRFLTPGTEKFRNQLVYNKCSAYEAKYCIIPIISFDFFTWFWYVTAFVVFFFFFFIFAGQSSHCWRTLHGYKIALSPTGAWTNYTICNHHLSKLRIIRTKTSFSEQFIICFTLKNNKARIVSVFKICSLKFGRTPSFAKASFVRFCLQDLSLSNN